MHIRQISYNYNSNRCINNLQTGDLAIETEFCGITIPSIGWDNTLDLKVTGYVNNLYDEQKTRTATIHFTSLVRNNVDISGTWNRVDIPDLKVNLTNKMKTKLRLRHYHFKYHTLPYVLWTLVIRCNIKMKKAYRYRRDVFVFDYFFSVQAFMKEK